MRPADDLRGQRFGKLTVLEPTELRDISRGMIWLCKCDCGNILNVRAQSLKRGITKSCGCDRSEKSRQRMLALRDKGLLGKRPLEDTPTDLDDEPPCDDDLWMFGGTQAINRLKKMFY